MMERLMKGTILKIAIFLGQFLIFRRVSALECYDSSYPVPHRRAECGPEMRCYSEYYAINRSGTIRQYYDRFCLHESHCRFRGIDDTCPTLNKLDNKMQTIFSKYHAKSAVHSIKYSEFCCCSTNLCNDVNHKRVYDKYGLQITISDAIIPDVSMPGLTTIWLFIASLIITIFKYL